MGADGQGRALSFAWARGARHEAKSRPNERQREAPSLSRPGSPARARARARRAGRSARSSTGPRGLVLRGRAGVEGEVVSGVGERASRRGTGGCREGMGGGEGRDARRLTGETTAKAGSTCHPSPRATARDEHHQCSGNTRSAHALPRTRKERGGTQEGRTASDVGLEHAEHARELPGGQRRVDALDEGDLGRLVGGFCKRTDGWESDWALSAREREREEERGEEGVRT